MTTIVAVQTPDDVLFAWDSMLTRGNEYGGMLAPKVWCRDGIVFAVSGSARFMDLLYAAEFPTYDGTEVRRWLIKTFVPVVQDLIVASGHTAHLLEDDTALMSGLIVVVDGTAHMFDAVLSPATTVEGVYTLGSGGDYARGALFAGADLQKALEIASAIDPYTAGKIHIASANEMIMAEEVE